MEEYDFCRFMSSESELLAWKAEGLPGDSLSGQNAVVILNSAPIVPLVIDPSTQVRWRPHRVVSARCAADGASPCRAADSPGAAWSCVPQASEWLVAHLRGTGLPLEVTTLHEPRFANTLELAVRFGKTLVVRVHACLRTLRWSLSQPM